MKESIEQSNMFEQSECSKIQVLNRRISMRISFKIWNSLQVSNTELH